MDLAGAEGAGFQQGANYRLKMALEGSTFFVEIRCSQRLTIVAVTSKRPNDAADVARLRRLLRRGDHVHILDSGAGVEEDGSVRRLQEPTGDEFLVRDQGCRSFRRRKNSFLRRPL